MLAGLFSKTAYRVAALAGVLVVAVLVVGCNDTYSEDQTYPIRTDPFKKKSPTSPSEPKRIEPPGQMDELRTWWLEGKGEFYEPAKIPDKEKADLDVELKKSFGTPAHPRVPGNESNTALKLDNATLEKGSKLFRRHCLHCHGMSGDGRGPTGPWVNPHPRDYRLGKFKFTSTTDARGVVNRKPSRDDLLRVLRNGVEGTSMPSFALLTSEELDQLASYVIHLSVRGKAELDAMRWSLVKGEDDDIKNFREAIDDSLKGELKAWAVAEQARIIPGPSRKVTIRVPQRDGSEKTEEIEVSNIPVRMQQNIELDPEIRKVVDKQLEQHLHESIEHGFKLFTVGSGGCVKCHSDFGRGNNYLWDDWGTVVRPANLTAGIYRGGRRPIDIFYRMHSGITGSNMPSFGRSEDLEEEIKKDPSRAKTAAGMSTDDIWDIVNFVEALPYPAMLPKDVCRDIYGEKIAEKSKK